MTLLLDTHALIWWLRQDPKLSPTARGLIASRGTPVRVSLVTAWEVAIKVGLGKWPEARDLLTNFETAIIGEGFMLLPISVAHVRASGLMQSPHRDPFDRLLAAQAQIEG